MNSRDRFQAEIRAYVERQSSKAAASRVLGISRQDLYRYLEGTTSPRPALLARLRQAMASPKRRRNPPGERDVVEIIGKENVTLVRQALLHLADALELDLKG